MRGPAILMNASGTHTNNGKMISIVIAKEKCPEG